MEIRLKKEIIFLFGLVFLIVGASIYYIFFPETIFVELIDKLLGLSYHIPTNIDNNLLKIIRFYLLDFIWAYALMSFVIYLFGYVKKMIIAVFLFVILMESLQIFSTVSGTFDVCDIVVEIIAGILVIFLFRRRSENEKY